MLSEAKRRYRPPLSVQANELIDVPLSELRKNKIGVLLWSEETSKEEDDQIEKMVEAKFLVLPGTPISQKKCARISVRLLLPDLSTARQSNWAFPWDSIFRTST
jgi:hypothetical protein